MQREFYANASLTQKLEKKIGKMKTTLIFTAIGLLLELILIFAIINPEIERLEIYAFWGNEAAQQLDKMELYRYILIAGCIFFAIDFIIFPIQISSNRKKITNLKQSHVIVGETAVTGVSFFSDSGDTPGRPFMVKYSEIISATASTGLLNLSINTKNGVIRCLSILGAPTAANMIMQRIKTLNAPQESAETVKTIETDAGSFCIKCGAKMKPEAVFCPKCGSKK